MLIYSGMKIQANNTWQDHSLCVDVQWRCSYAFCTLHQDQLSSVSLSSGSAFQIRSDQLSSVSLGAFNRIRLYQIRSVQQPFVSLSSLYYTLPTHKVFRSVGQFSILFSQMCADAQQFSHRSCQTCQTVPNDIKLDQLNIKGTFKTKTGNNQQPTHQI